MTTRVAKNIKRVKMLGEAPDAASVDVVVVVVELSGVVSCIGVVAVVGEVVDVGTEDDTGIDVSFGISMVKVTLVYPIFPTESFPYA